MGWFRPSLIGDSDRVTKSELMLCVSMNLILVSLFVGAFHVRTVSAQAPYLAFVTEYYYCPLLDSNPHGRLNVQVDVSKLMNDGSSSYDWYFYSNIPLGSEGIRLQTVPGRVSYSSDWETAHTYARHTVWSAGVVRWLVDYGPTTTDGYTSGSTTAAVTVSVPPAFTYSQSYSYNVPYIKVIDKSDFAVHRAFWEHDFNEQGDPGSGNPSDSTYLARPAFVIRTSQDYSTYVDAWYKVEWGHPVLWWWEYAGFESSILHLDYVNPNEPGGGCPTLYVWSGSDYAREGILNIHAVSDITVQHMIQNGAVPQNGFYNLQLREEDNFTSHIDQVKLIAIDKQNGQHLCPLVSAKRGSNYATLRLFYDDEIRVDLESEQTMSLKFLSILPPAQVNRLVFEINGYNAKVP
jgi:hypothetical protein